MAANNGKKTNPKAAKTDDGEEDLTLPDWMIDQQGRWEDRLVDIIKNAPGPADTQPPAKK